MMLVGYGSDRETRKPGRQIIVERANSEEGGTLDGWASPLKFSMLDIDSCPPGSLGPGYRAPATPQASARSAFSG